MRQQCLKKVIDIGFGNVRSGFMPDRTFAILFLYCLYWIYRKPYDIMKKTYGQKTVWVLPVVLYLYGASEGGTKSCWIYGRGKGGGTRDCR